MQTSMQPRQKLMDILSNYQGFKKCTLILVFDAYKIEGHAEEVITYHNIHVVYTKEAETADQYIEKTVHKIGREKSGNGSNIRWTGADHHHGTGCPPYVCQRSSG